MIRLIGSYTNVVGLPLAEAAALLAGEGYPVLRQLDAGMSEKPRPPARQAVPDLRQAFASPSSPRSARAAAPTSTSAAG